MTRARFDVATSPIDPGITLIEASAGTGKTYCLTRLVLRLLLERRVESVAKIVVMTFTNAATSELVDRIRNALGKAIGVYRGESADNDAFLASLPERYGEDGLAILTSAQRDLDDLEVCTIHGFCRRVLEQYAFESGTPFEVEYVEDSRPLLARAAQDFWRRTVYPAGDLVAAVAVHEGWLPSSFALDYEKCRTHPGIAIEPPPPELATAIEALARAAVRVREAWGAPVARTLGALDYAKDKIDVTAHVARLEAFCARREPAAVGAALDTSSQALRKRLKNAAARGFMGFAFTAACDELATAVNDLEQALRGAFLRDVDVLVEQEKRSARAAGFDDLLHRLYGALIDPRRSEGLARTAGAQFEAVLVDEFQDTDTVQYEIFKRLFARSLVFFIGDPKQAIYSFRGADVFAYLRAAKDARNEFALDRNWRSEPALVSAVSAVFGRNPRPFVIEQIAFDGAQAAERPDQPAIAGDSRRALEWLWLEDQTNKRDGRQAACREVASEVAFLLGGSVRIGERPIAPNDIAVLVRTNSQAELVQAELLKARIPSVVSQAGSIFASNEARELHSLLLAVASPRREGAVRGAMATRAWGMDAAAIAGLAQDEERWQRWVEELESLRVSWTRKGFAAMAQRLLALCDARAHLLGSAAGERKLTNLLHAVELAQQAAAQQHLSPDGLIAWYAHALAHPALYNGETAELRLESDADAVQIVTIHKSKGLEYGVVFCPFLWDARADKPVPPFLVHLGDGRAVYRCTPGDAAREAAFAEECLSEATRLAYVALTRAKHRCYVAWGRIGRGAETTALAHLLRSDGAQGAGTPVEREQVQDLCAAHPEIMALRDTGAGAPRVERAERAIAPRLAAREYPASALGRLVPWRVASFSSFRASAQTVEGEPIGAARVAAASIGATVPLELPDHADPPLARPEQDIAPGGMFGFARGARAGTCLHEILERWDFANPGDEQTSELIAGALRRHGLEHGAAHAACPEPAPTVAALLGELADSELPGAKFKLRAVEGAARLNEWQFYLPMASVSQSKLADCFARHGSPAIKDEYPRSLKALGESEVRGFLMGFVDLVFTHGGRWYVLDWKSNHLGNTLGDYDERSLARVMREDHYILQYHLYALALHRYLAQRLPAYEYDRHFGGVYYCFLRAMRAGRPSGWYFDRPAPGLIDALDSLVRGAGAP